jgi:hypothetical protein
MKVRVRDKNLLGLRHGTTRCLAPITYLHRRYVRLERGARACALQSDVPREVPQPWEMPKDLYSLSTIGGVL